MPQANIRRAQAGGLQWLAELGEVCSRGGGGVTGAKRVDWTPGEYGPQPHLGRARRGSGTKVATVEPASTCARSPACMSDCWLGVLGERLTVKVGVSLTLLPAPRTLSLHWAASSSFNVRVCGWTYCVLSGVWCHPWEACSSLGEGGEWIWRRSTVGQGGLRAGEGERESCSRMYCMKE